MARAGKPRGGKPRQIARIAIGRGHIGEAGSARRVGAARPTANTGNASSSPRRGWPASARAPLALVISIAAQGPAPRSASATARCAAAAPA